LAIETDQNDRKNEAFLVGIFSMLDLLVGEELSVVLSDIPLGADVKEALLGGKNIFSQLLDLTVCYEFADWADVERIIKELGIKENRMINHYVAALDFAAAVMKG
jgi:EAL and modified HD-GYP domain-containing signal transduction protein